MYPFGPEWVKHPREGWPAPAEQTALAERIKHLPRQLSKSIRRQPDLVQPFLVMSAILPFTKIDSDSLLANYFTHYQICWIQAEDPFHEAKKQVFALAEKSVRIGWTFCDGFKNVRKRLRFKNRDYLFVTKDWPTPPES